MEHRDLLVEVFREDGDRLSVLLGVLVDLYLGQRLVREDEDRSNHCWEALGKQRPNEDAAPELPDFGSNPDFDVE